MNNFRPFFGLNLQKYTISGGRKGADLLFLKECFFGNHKCTVFSPFSVKIYMYILFWDCKGAAPPCLRKSCILRAIYT